jgi:phosphoglycerate-specific signal transduction histidine kinase
MNLTQTPKRPQSELTALLHKAEKDRKRAKLDRALKDTRAWAAGVINDELSRNLSKLGVDSMYRMASIAEGMLGYYLDYYREIEKIELNFNPLLNDMEPSKKERRELIQALTWAREKLEKNFANFYVTNKQMVDMCTRVDKVQQEKLNQIEEEIFDELVTSYNTKHIQVETYLEPAPKEEAYLLTCKTIAINLAIYSKGALYLTPTEVAQELSARNFTPLTTKGYVKADDKMFYVKIK